MIDVANLPDNVELLKAIVIAQKDCNDRLEILIMAFKQAMFGRKSEKLDSDQFELALEDVEAGMASIEAERDSCEVTPKSADTKPRSTNRGSLPKHLPRIEEIVEPEGTECSCGGELHVMCRPTVECAAFNERGRGCLGTSRRYSGAVPGRCHTPS